MRARGFVGVGISLALLLCVGSARADVVEELYDVGNRAAARGDWSEAAGCYEQARALLPDRSGELSYNLGTAYAQLGEPGFAAYHLRRAIRRESAPSAEVVEGARRNLSILDRRIEEDAERTGAQFSLVEGWWPRLRSALAARWLGFLAWFGGMGLIAALVVGAILRRRGQATLVPRAIAWVMAGLFSVVALGHGVAIRGEARAAQHIVLPKLALAREGPSAGRPVAVKVVGGSQVREIEARGDWTQVRLSNGLAGWLPNEELADLRADESTAVLAGIPQCPTDR